MDLRLTLSLLSITTTGYSQNVKIESGYDLYIPDWQTVLTEGYDLYSAGAVQFTAANQGSVFLDNRVNIGLTWEVSFISSTPTSGSDEYILGDSLVRGTFISQTNMSVRYRTNGFTYIVPHTMEGNVLYTLKATPTTLSLYKSNVLVSDILMSNPIAFTYNEIGKRGTADYSSITLNYIKTPQSEYKFATGEGDRVYDSNNVNHGTLVTDGTIKPVKLIAQDTPFNLLTAAETLGYNVYPTFNQSTKITFDTFAQFVNGYVKIKGSFGTGTVAQIFINGGNNSNYTAVAVNGGGGTSSGNAGTPTISVNGTLVSSDAELYDAIANKGLVEILVENINTSIWTELSISGYAVTDRYVDGVITEVEVCYLNDANVIKTDPFSWDNVTTSGTFGIQASNETEVGSGVDGFGTPIQDPLQTVTIYPMNTQTALLGWNPYAHFNGDDTGVQYGNLGSTLDFIFTIYSLEGTVGTLATFDSVDFIGSIGEGVTNTQLNAAPLGVLTYTINSVVYTNLTDSRGDLWTAIKDDISQNGKSVITVSQITHTYTSLKIFAYNGATFGFAGLGEANINSITYNSENDWNKGTPLVPFSEVLILEDLNNIGFDLLGNAITRPVKEDAFNWNGRLGTRLETIPVDRTKKGALGIQTLAVDKSYLATPVQNSNSGDFFLEFILGEWVSGRFLGNSMNSTNIRLYTGGLLSFIFGATISNTVPLSANALIRLELDTTLDVMRFYQNGALMETVAALGTTVIAWDRVGIRNGAVSNLTVRYINQNGEHEYIFDQRGGLTVPDLIGTNDFTLESDLVTPILPEWVISSDGITWAFDDGTSLIGGSSDFQWIKPSDVEAMRLAGDDVYKSLLNNLFEISYFIGGTGLAVPYSPTLDVWMFMGLVTDNLGLSTVYIGSVDGDLIEIPREPSGIFTASAIAMIYGNTTAITEAMNGYGTKYLHYPRQVFKDSVELIKIITGSDLEVFFE